MKNVLVLIVLALTCCAPAWALYDCWEGRTVSSLATESDVVVIGVITGVEPLGCRLKDNSIGACPTLPELVDGFLDRASKVKFAVHKVLKGHVGKNLDFVVFKPDLLVGCEGPGMKLYTHSLTFLHREGDNLVAWGGDRSIYQLTRADYGAVVKKASAALQSPNGESNHGQ